MKLPAIQETVIALQLGRKYYYTKRNSLLFCHHSFALNIQTETKWLKGTELLLYAEIPLAICFICSQHSLDKKRIESTTVDSKNDTVAVGAK